MSLRGLLLAILLLSGLTGHAAAQINLPSAPPASATPAEPSPVFAPPIPYVAPSTGLLSLSANFGTDTQRIMSGLSWRVFRPDGDGKNALVAQSADPAPVFSLPYGEYLVHVSYGLVGGVRKVTISAVSKSERVALNAGGLRVVGLLGELRVPPERLSISIFVPEGQNPQGKLVARDVRSDQIVRLPEGPYHIISTYLDTLTAGASASPTNSVVDADVRIQAGRITEASLRHRAAQMTLKLVNGPGGEALANTAFTVLTPGGDVIREMIGAFPSLVLAEGEYVAIARRDGRTYQGTFTVRAGRDREVEILARDPPRQ
ncbi:MAG: hypothetical protein K2Y29_11150 [Beijerinckiaceae bacterium]|nr:hypothetical protein [Beijerinckiaceae bacterium]